MEEREDKKLPPGLEKYIERRKAEVREAIFNYLNTMTEPTTVSEIARKVGRCKPTVVQALSESLKNGNPHNLGIKKLGKYDVIYKMR